MSAIKSALTSPKFYLTLLSALLLLAVSVGAKTVTSATALEPSEVMGFREIEFEDSSCWEARVFSAHTTYRNICSSDAEVEIEHLDKSKGSHEIVPGGKLIIYGAVVHILGEAESM